MTEQQPKVCAVCGRPCDLIYNKWGHIHDMLTPEPDHVVVPVDYDTIPVNAACDFCHADTDVSEGMTVPAESFMVPVVGTASEGNWYACRECAELVRRRRWTQLVNRVADSFMERNPDDDRASIKRFMKLLYDRLDVHLTGPPRPWRAGDERMTNS